MVNKDKAIFEQNLRKNPILKREYKDFHKIDSLFDLLEEVDDHYFEQLFKEIQHASKVQKNTEEVDIEATNENRIIEFFKGLYATPQAGWGMSAILFGLLIVSSVISFQSTPLPDQRVLTIANPISSNYKSVNIVFADNATQKEIRNLLISFKAQIANGPTATGMYTLYVFGTTAQVHSKIRKLKKSKLILLAEPAFI